MPDDADAHIDAARTRLLDLSALAAKTVATERRILAAAEDRLATVETDLGKLRPRVHTDPAADQQYQTLTLERGQLFLIIAQAMKVLG